MSFWSRLTNTGRAREIEEELQAHVLEAIRGGRDPAEVRRAFGSPLRHYEAARDIRLIPWLDSLRADAVFSWRQLRKRKVTSAAAIFSLALAIGSCTAAFRLIDALLLRPMPISEPERLYALFRSGIGPDGKPRVSDSYEYPLFRDMRSAVKDRAELIVASYGVRRDVTFGSDQQMEKAGVQYVSGWMFRSFGLKPTLGRLLTPDDDHTPGTHPYAVLSYDYWMQRFGGDAKVIGRTFRMANDIFEIVGVGPETFTGTEPGTVTAIFLPTMMHAGVSHSDWSWFRIFVRLKPGMAPEPVRERLVPPFRAFREEVAKGFTARPKMFVDRFLNETLTLKPAAVGLSDMQKDYGRALSILGVLVALVLLIACANVANLMTAQAAVRAREMALRVSIGAGRRRLVQLVLSESALVAFLAAALGCCFAWFAAPLIVGMINPPDNPARLILPADWRVFCFGAAVTLGVTFLFGLAPALRASSVRPASALKGGEDPHSRRRLMYALVAVQAAFCFLVLFVAGLFAATFDRLTHQPTGFSAERLLDLDTVAVRPQSAVYWNQVAAHLRAIPGVEKVALAGWPLLDGNGWNGFVSIHPGQASDVLNYFLSVSPGWVDAMKIQWISGRDFRPGDIYPGPVIVNETFAKLYFNGENPVGRIFEKVDRGYRMEIVGVVRDARYRNMREPIAPTVYVPFQESEYGAFVVRTSGANPVALAGVLRNEVSRARSEFWVSNVRTQAEINQSQTVRERLLAMMALFFAVVALLLAGVGLYGVLDYSVLQRRREIGIRMAIGARAGDIAWLVTTDVFAMVLAGAIAGLALGMASARYIESLFYEVKPTDAGVLALPTIALITAALLASAPAVVRAVRIDPASMFRSE